MAIVNVNGISGINSITAQGTSLNFYTAAGSNLPISAATLNVGTGASVSSPATNVLTLGTNSVEALRIDSSGNIGVNSTSPSAIVGSGKILNISNTGHATISIQAIDSTNDRNSVLELLSSGNGGSESKIVYGDTDTTPGTSSPLVFYGRHSGTTTEKLRITSSGNLGIGTNNPSSKLQVQGTIGLGASDDLESSFSGGRTKLTSSPSGFVINHNDNSATIFQNQGVERARISTSGNLGIGTNNPLGVLAVSGGISNPTITFQNGSATNTASDAAVGSIVGYSRTTGGNINIGSVDIRTDTSSASSGVVRIITASNGVLTEAARFNSSGNLAFPSGQGIDFSATTNSAGTMTSELLSDYEEGTFEIGVSGSGGPTITSQKCTYVKIGKLVTCNIRVAIRQGTATGNQTIVFLPFTSTNTTNYAAVGKGYWSNAATSIVELVCRIGQATTNMTVYRSTAAAATLTVWQGADWQAASDTDWDFTITYRTDS